MELLLLCKAAIIEESTTNCRHAVCWLSTPLYHSNRARHEKLDHTNFCGSTICNLCLKCKLPKQRKRCTNPSKALKLRTVRFKPFHDKIKAIRDDSLYSYIVTNAK